MELVDNRWQYHIAVAAIFVHLVTANQIARLHPLTCASRLRLYGVITQ